MVIGCYWYNLLKILKQPHASSKTNGLNKIKQLLQGPFLDGQTCTTFLSQPCRFGKTHGQMVQKETWWLLGWFFLSDLGSRRTCTAIPATSAEHRQGGHLAVALAVELVKRWWVLRHSCFIWWLNPSIYGIKTYNNTPAKTPIKLTNNDMALFIDGWLMYLISIYTKPTKPERDTYQHGKVPRPSKMCRVPGMHILSGGTGALGIAGCLRRVWRENCLEHFLLTHSTGDFPDIF